MVASKFSRAMRQIAPLGKVSQSFVSSMFTIPSELHAMNTIPVDGPDTRCMFAGRIVDHYTQLGLILFLLYFLATKTIA